MAIADEKQLERNDGEQAKAQEWEKKPCCGPRRDDLAKSI